MTCVSPRLLKQSNSDLTIAFVGPHVQVQPDTCLNASDAIDFVVRGEFDHAVVEFARGHAPADIAGVSYRRDGKVIHNPSRPLLHAEDLDDVAVCDGGLQTRPHHREL